MEEDLMEYAPNIPDNVLELIFSFLKLQDLRNCTLVCKSWYRFFCDENNEVWRAQCLQKVPAEAFKNDLLTVVPTYKAKLRAYFHAWNPFDCSRHVYIKPNGFTLHRCEMHYDEKNYELLMSYRPVIMHCNTPIFSSQK